MRPLELKVRNFRSYSGEHTFDFAGRSLVAIVGPIGSGKSSILDAIVFGLYGRTPRIPTATKTLINQRAADGAVSLRFEVEGELWEVTRSIRVKGASRHALYRYEDPDGEPAEKITLEGEVNDKIVALLGLDYAAFERSVLLAQGRFAEFLQARPSDRDRVLKGVFGHDRVDLMKTLAKDRRDQLTLDLETLKVRLERFEELRERVAANNATLLAARDRHDELEKAAKIAEELDAQQTAAQKRADAVARRMATFDEQAARIPQVSVASRSIADATVAGKRRSDLAKQLHDGQQALQTADQNLKQAQEANEPGVLERAAALLAASEPQLKAVVAADRRITTTEQLLADAQGALELAEKELVEAKHLRDVSLGRAVEAAKIVEEAETALQRGRHADMAATLRAGLKVQEPCPVCAQPVAELPAAVGDPHLNELEEVVASARKTKLAVDKSHTDSLTELEKAKGQVRAAAERVATAESQLAGAQTDANRARGDLEETNLQLEEVLGAGDIEAHLQKRRAAYESLASAREHSQREVDRIRQEHDQAIREEQDAAKTLQDLSMRVADVAARLEMRIEIGPDPGSLGDALEKLRTFCSTTSDEMRTERESVAGELEKVAKARGELLAKAGVTGDVTSALAVIGDRIVQLERAIADDETELEKAGELTQLGEQVASRVDVFARINKDLTDSRFIRYLLDDERARLAELGSEHFQRLSAGRYRFADDQFAILDLTAANVTRRADSLSGGETFLASLGLALALAEMVAGTGGRLDAFFLDEGFGTLDPEHLDLAMEGIETLVAEQTDRLIVIVSHVPELRERIEDLIELDRNPVTGDTRVVSS